MRVTNLEGNIPQEPTKDLEDKSDELEFEEPTGEVEYPVTTKDLEDEEEENQELYDLLPKGWDNVDWDGGERLPESQQEVNAILDGYYAKKYESAYKRSEEERLQLLKELEEKQRYEEDFDEDEIYDEDTEMESMEEEEDPSYLKRRIILWSSLGTVFVVLLAIGGYFLFNREPTTIAEIQSKVNRLYTSEAKIDIKNSVSLDTLETYYLSLKEISSDEKKTNAAVSVEHELDTIGYFISDNAMVDEFLDTKYDLSSASLRENLEKIKENLNKYTVSGLSLTVKDKCTKVESELGEYEALKAELSAITDINTFVPSNYEPRINAITHDGNKKELKVTFDKLAKDKEEADALKKAEELAVQEAQKQTEAAKQKAEEEKARLQKELDKTKQQLKEQLDKGKDVVQDVTGWGDAEEGEEQESGYYYYENEEE